MKPEFKIKREILRSAQENYPEEFVFGLLDTDEQVKVAYDNFGEMQNGYDYQHELECEFRSGDVNTGLPADSSRHYESKAVAMKTAEGDWVGWTFWYGGGKHGEPESIDWMSDAYDLKCTEEEKVVVVRNFEIIKT